MKLQFALSLVGVTGALTTSAFAQDRTGEKQPSSPYGTAPSRAVEITTRTGYSQGFGTVAKSDFNLKDVARNGFALELGVGYRFNPNWMLGGYAEGGLYRPAHGGLGDSRAWSAAAGVATQWHFLPFSRVDPWLGAGTGWRSYWVVGGDRDGTALAGLDLLRLQAGVECHVSESFVISPTLGASISTFLAEKQPTDSGLHSLSDPRVTSFVFAGLESRFDLGGQRVRQSSQVASR